MNKLNMIIGARKNVSVLVYEHYNNLELCIGGFYYSDRVIKIDDGKYASLDVEAKEFHWSANNLKIFIN